jgi:hypothetical protein
MVVLRVKIARQDATPKHRDQDCNRNQTFRVILAIAIGLR